MILSVLILSCSDKSMKDTESELALKRSAIIELANSGDCLSDSSCRMMGWGSKPCGGPEGYLVYATSIDTIRLVTLVQEYNDLEGRYNKEMSLISDCSIAIPPDSLSCLNEKCVKFYKGVPVPN